MTDKQRRLLTIAAACIFLAGFLAVATVLLIHIPTDHPFNGANSMAEEFGMTRAEVDAFNPKLSAWMIHVSDQVGSTSLGWGLFLMALAWLGIRKGSRTAWWALWIGGTPTVAYSAFGEYIMFGTWDIGSLLSLGVLVIFLIGMVLPIPVFRHMHAEETHHTDEMSQVAPVR